MRSLVVGDEARRELATIIAWYNAQQLELGKRLNGVLDSRLAAACAMPNSFPVLIGRQRRVRADPFPVAAVYVVQPERIVVVAVVDLRQDPKTIRRRLRRES